jgi:hypothetical protein
MTRARRRPHESLGAVVSMLAGALLFAAACASRSGAVRDGGGGADNPAGRAGAGGVNGGVAGGTGGSSAGSGVAGTGTGVAGSGSGVAGKGGGRGGNGGGRGGNAGGGVGGSGPSSSLFPLHVSSDHGSLISDDGKPFLLHTEAAWSLIAELTTADAMAYLTDRYGRGVDALLVNLIEHKYADNAPADAAGDAPFTTAGDFSKPNEAYFAHADQVIDLAASEGMVVLLTPSYLGYSGGDEGWYQEMTALSAAKCRSYGDFLGKRYAAKKNIIWIWGGDYTPPAGAGETCMMNIRDGIRAADPAALASAHWAPESTSRDEPNFTSSIDLVGVYTYQTILPACRAARAATPRMPVYLLETCYEHETIQGCAGTSAEVRRRQWWGFLGCGAGEIAGNNPIWKFGSGWQQQLGSPVSLAEARMVTLAQTMAWATFDLDDALVSANRGTGYAEIAAARSADHRQAMIYVPPDGAATITLDLTQMSGPVTATWQDPTTARSVAAGTSLSGSKMLTTPGNNAGGDKDWVLVLSAP